MEIGKKELCEHLGWSRPTLDKRINGDPNFPIKARGGKGGGWKFEPGVVVAYLKGAASTPGETPESSGAEDDAQPLLPLGRQPIVHKGEATASERHKNAQAALIEDRLRRQRGELVERADMREVLDAVLAELKSSLQALPTLIGKKHDLSERVIDDVQQQVEGMMRGAAARIRTRLSDA